MPFNFNNYRSIPSSIKLNGPVLAYTRQPTDAIQTSDKTVVFNATVESSFIGTGEVAEGSYIFKWYLNDVELSESGSDVSVFNNGGSSQLTLSNVGFSFNGNEVYVISSYDPASNEGALNNPNLKSNVVNITAFDELEITSQPQDFVGAEKLTANFNVGARILPSTSRQNISYQWQMNNRDLFDGLISGGDLDKYGITQVPVAQVTPSFQVTADDGSESFVVDWSSVSSFKSFTPGKTYTIVPNTTINTKIFAQGAGGGRDGDKSVIGSSGGVAAGYATFIENQTYKLQVGKPGEGGKRVYPSSTVTHRFDEFRNRTLSLTSSSEISVEAMNPRAYSTNETRTVRTRERVRVRLPGSNRLRFRTRTITRIEKVPVPANCSLNYGYRYYKITFSTPMSNDQYEVNVAPTVALSASDQQGIFTVAGIADKTKEGFNIWFCNNNPNTGASYADYISTFSFSLVGMRNDTTQDGEGGFPGGGGNSLPAGITLNQAGGGGGYTGLFFSSITQANTMIVAGGGGGSSASLSVGGNGGSILNAGETSSSGFSASGIKNVIGGALQAEYTTPGTHSWTAPDGVTSVSVVCVGGGSDYNYNTNANRGGSGGGLGWKNNIPVVPGNSYTVRVGDRGLNSFFINASTVKGGGGQLTRGGDFEGDGGGNGGLGGIGTWEGGGGAGGYSGNGGNGSNGNDRDDNLGFPGAGGGGGGGGGWFAGGGGGVGLLGEGDSGVGGIGRNNNTNNGGGGGSNGQKGTAYSQSRNVTGQSTTGGGLYGGGGGRTQAGTLGGAGAVRIMWGENRAYPSTNVADQFESFDMTGSGGTSSAGGIGGSTGSDKGDDGSAFTGGNGADGAGGGGAGYFGGGGGGGTLIDSAICISVIDEASPAKSVIASDWDNFRSAYPTRPFWLLKPAGRPGSLKVPSAYTNDPIAYAPQTVNRDGGNVNQASDWFTMCDLSQAASGTSISLAIDNSGSMRASQVQASINLLRQKCEAAGLKVYQVSIEPLERWVVPHNKSLPEKLIGGGGGGSSFVSSTLMTPNDLNITTKDYSSNVEGNGSLNISFIGAIPSQPELISVVVNGANSSSLSLYSEQGGIGSNVRCTLSSQTAFNSPLYSETASYKVIDIRPILVIEAIDAINGWINSTKTNLETVSQIVLTSSTFGSTYKIIQFYSEESDFNLDIDIKAAAGASTAGGSGGQGGTSKIRVNIKKDVEYTMIGLAENSAIFLYEKARLIAVVGQGGDAGDQGNGGAGGGVNVDGITGRGTRPGKGGIRPVSGSLTSAGIYGSTVNEDTIELYPEDAVASDQSGGRTISCTKGLIYIDEGISPCQDVSSEKVRFLDEDGTQYVQSSLLFRGFKAGYSVTETAGSGFIGSTRSGGDGGNGATGGDGGTTNSGGGGGSGYVDDSVTVINTTSGGNPNQFSSVTFSISPV